jgi:hypothetical protein
LKLGFAVPAAGITFARRGSASGLRAAVASIIIIANRATAPHIKNPEGT